MSKLGFLAAAALATFFSLGQPALGQANIILTGADALLMCEDNDSREGTICFSWVNGNHQGGLGPVGTTGE